MRRAVFIFLNVGLLISLLSLTACGQGAANASSAPPTAAAASATPSPVGSPAAQPSSTPTATESASPTATSTATSTPSPTSSATVTATTHGISIEIVDLSPDHVIIQPGDGATIPIGNGEISILAHYPSSLGSTTGGDFRPYPITITVDPADWQVEMGNWPRSDTLSFRLRGTTPGRHTVTIAVGQSPFAPVSFAVNLVATASSPTATPSGPRTVTLADDGKTIDLQTDETFLLALGEGYDWTISVADQSIVSRVVGILVVRGAQGIYRAHQPGQTTLTAIGDPLCRQAQPACGLPSRAFHIQIVVR